MIKKKKMDKIKKIQKKKKTCFFHPKIILFFVMKVITTIKLYYIFNSKSKYISLNTKD